MQRGISEDQIQRVARIYKSNQDACKAIGITLRSFSRLCRKYGVETPYARRLRRCGQDRQLWREAPAEMAS